MKKLIIGLLLISSPAMGGDFSFTHLFSGDSLLMEDGQGRMVKFNLAGIVAPDIGQPYGKESVDYLEQLILADAPIEFRNVKRILPEVVEGEVFVGNRSLAAEMVHGGFAWADVRSRNGLDDFSALLDNMFYRIERKARREEKGLWAQPNPEPPWAYKKRMGIHSIESRLMAEVMSKLTNEADRPKTDMEVCMAEKTADIPYNAKDLVKAVLYIRAKNSCLRLLDPEAYQRVQQKKMMYELNRINSNLRGIRFGY